MTISPKKHLKKVCETLNTPTPSDQSTPVARMPIQLATYKSDLNRGSSRLREYAWVFVKCLFFTPNYPLPSFLRVWLLRCFGAQIGKGVVIRSGVSIAFPWRLVVGDYVWIGEEVMLLNLAEIRIESNCCISQRAFLCTGSHDFRKPTFDLITKPIHIREGSWVAAMAFVGPGVEIGPNSMVSAGCVVTQRVEPSTNVASTKPIGR